MSDPVVRRVEHPALEAFRPKPKPTAAEAEKDILTKLLQAIDVPPEPPKIGAAAAQAMRNCFDQTAKDIELLATDAVDRALQIQAEAKVFAEILRDAGRVLCDRIELEASRDAQISQIMRTARSVIASSQAPPEPPQ